MQQDSKETRARWSEVRSQHRGAQDKLRSKEPISCKGRTSKKCAEADPESKRRWIKRIDWAKQYHEENASNNGSLRLPLRPEEVRRVKRCYQQLGVKLTNPHWGNITELMEDEVCFVSGSASWNSVETWVKVSMSSSISCRMASP